MTEIVNVIRKSKTGPSKGLFFQEIFFAVKISSEEIKIKSKTPNPNK